MNETKLIGSGPGRSSALVVAAAICMFMPAVTFAGGGLDLRSSSLAGAGQPFAVVATDLNRDGKVDLAVTNPKVATISIYLGRGDGTFREPSDFSTRSRPRGITAADFNEDGLLDLAVASTGANAVSLHLGAGDGTFAAATSFPVQSRPFMLEPADLNQDGHLDLVVSNESERETGLGLSVLLGDGAGHFSVSSVSTGRYASDVAVADFNRDGKADVAVSTWGTNDVNVHFGRGDGTVEPRRSFTYKGHGLYRVLAADLDRDGNPDMVWNDLLRSGLYVLYGDGKGNFPRTQLLPAQRGVRHAAAADLNGDGWLDLVSSNTGAGSISLMLSDGRGGFLPTQNFATGTFTRMTAIADLNGDERLDLAVTNLSSDTITVFLNHGPAPLQVEVAEAEEPTPERAAPLELASFRFPNGIDLDPSGKHLLVSDQQNHRIARVEIGTGAVTTVAGTGEPGGEGDGGPAFRARLNTPCDVVMDDGGSIYIADLGNNRVRKVDPAGTISTVAGTGEPGFAGDGGPAASAQLSAPFAVALDGAGSLYIADFGNRRIRVVDPAGTIRTVAGTGMVGGTDDAAIATETALGSVTDLAFLPNGDLLIVDQFKFRLRRLAPDGTITTAAGTGKTGFAGDGGPAIAAQLNFPSGVAADAAGNIYIADQDGNRIRKITPDGIINTFAGQAGKLGYGGDGGPATQALVWFPSHVVTDAQGNLFFTDRFNHCIRKVDPSGIITTVAGKPDPQQQARKSVDLDALPEGEAQKPMAPDARLELEWKYQFRSGSDANAAYAVAADEGGGIYVAGDVGSGADWRVVHLDPSGKESWRFGFDSGGVDIPYGLALTPDGQVVVAGTVFGRKQTNSLVISLSPDGTEKWRRQDKGEAGQIARGIASDAESNLYVVGESDRTWDVKSLSPSGQVRWTYGDEQSGSAWAVDVDREGGVLVAGHEQSAWRVVKLSREGKLEWEHKVPASVPRPYSAVAYGVRVDRLGNAIVTGTWRGRTNSLRVEKLDPSGHLLWEYVDGNDAGIGTGRDVAIDAGGNAIVVGENAEDWVMLALDPDGKLLWRTTYDGGDSSTNKDQAHAVAVVEPDSIVVAGVIHPVPPKFPSLGPVDWRVARYKLVLP